MRPLPGDLVIRVEEPEALRGVETYGEGFVIESGAVAAMWIS